MYEYVPYLGWGTQLGILKLPKKAISSVWHRVRPFHCPKMISGSVSISCVLSQESDASWADSPYFDLILTY
jgi:hypothetical protein